MQPRRHEGAKKTLKFSALVVALVLLGSAPRAQQTTIPTPSDFLKINVGGDGVLATYEQIVCMQFKLPVKNVLEGLAGGGEGGGGGGAIGPDSAAFYAPGSIVRTKVDVTSPIAYGSDAESIAWFEQSPAFEVSGNARSIITYPASGSPLLSGWLLGAEKLNGKSAVVDAPVGKGRVILFGFRPQYRAQTWATFKLLFNALYYSTVESAT